MPPHIKVDFYDMQRLAVMSNAVYLSDQTTHGQFDDLERTYGADQLTMVDLPETHSRYLHVLDRAGGRQFLVARGTANLRNVVTDINVDIEMDTRAGVPVHEGFMKAAAEVASHADEVLDADLPLVLTGHSLGGAIAAILAMEYAAEGRDVSEVITFGQPKVTTEDGVVKWRHLPLLRVVDRLDPVPRVPVHGTLGMKMPLFQHFGREVVLLGRRRYIHRPELLAESEDADSAWDVVHNKRVSDHYMDSYLKQIKGCVAGAREVADDPAYL